MAQQRLRTGDRWLHLQLVFVPGRRHAGMARHQSTLPNVRLIRLMCSGRLDPQFVAQGNR